MNKYYYLIVIDGVVIGYTSDLIAPENLPDNEELVKITTAEPDRYIGLTKCQIFEDPLPLPPALVVSPVNDIKAKVKKLCCEIEALKQLGECTADLKFELNQLKTEYQFLKNKHHVLPLNF